jgi:hypothetical protein
MEIVFIMRKSRVLHNMYLVFIDLLLILWVHPEHPGNTDSIASCYIILCKYILYAYEQVQYNFSMYIVHGVKTHISILVYSNNYNNMP